MFVRFCNEKVTIVLRMFGGIGWNYTPKIGKIPLRFNPLVTNGRSHPYHLDESMFISRGIRSNFSFLFERGSDKRVLRAF